VVYGKRRRRLLSGTCQREKSVTLTEKQPANVMPTCNRWGNICCKPTTSPFEYINRQCPGIRLAALNHRGPQSSKMSIANCKNSIEERKSKVWNFSLVSVMILQGEQLLLYGPNSLRPIYPYSSNNRLFHPPVIAFQRHGMNHGMNGTQ
jgi:hypothetical protein